MYPALLDASSYLFIVRRSVRLLVRRSICPVLFSKVKSTHTRHILCRVSGLVPPTTSVPGKSTKYESHRISRFTKRGKASMLRPKESKQKRHFFYPITFTKSYPGGLFTALFLSYAVTSNPSSSSPPAPRSLRCFFSRRLRVPASALPFSASRGRFRGGFQGSLPFISSRRPSPSSPSISLRGRRLSRRH